MNTTFLRIADEDDFRNYGLEARILIDMAIVQNNLVRAGNDSAIPHLIAIVEELETVYGFKFEIID